MSFYDTIEEYNGDVIAAREAYWADMRVLRGECETGDGRKKDGRHRKCWTCRHSKAAS